jgi:hypothetical protein
LAYILQVRTKNLRKQWRILLRPSKLLVAECWNEKEVVREWTYLHSTPDSEQDPSNVFEVADGSRAASHFYKLAQNLNEQDIHTIDQVWSVAPAINYFVPWVSLCGTAGVTATTLNDDQSMACFEMYRML